MKIITFGEIMLRIEPSGFKRFRQALPGSIDCTFGGAEANVAVSLAFLGMDASYVTALPFNALADSCIGSLRNFGVDTSHVNRSANGRLGLYFVEKGANQRASQVIYDRDNSTVSLTESTCYNWDRIFEEGNWFHISGITPSISSVASDVSIDAVKRAKGLGLKVSIDLNYRKKLWRWKEGTSPRELARKIMGKILPYVDLVIGNEEDAYDILGISAGNTNVASGNLETDKYPEVASKIVNMYPNVSKVAITLRESLSATHNNWGAMLFDAKEKKSCFAPEKDGVYSPYQIKNIVDRVGGGDSFAAGLIYALNDPELKESAKAVAFAAASSCLNHSIEGDFNLISREEAISLMDGNASGRVKR